MGIRGRGEQGRGKGQRNVMSGASREKLAPVVSQARKERSQDGRGVFIGLQFGINIQ